MPNGSLTDVGEAAVLDWAFTSSAVTRPTAWYAALFTVTPGETGGGTEVTGGGYARQPVTFVRSGTAPTQVANNANTEWPTATASYGGVSGIAIFDAPTGGNMWAYGAALNPVTGLADTETVNVGNIYRLNAGDLVITLD